MIDQANIGDLTQAVQRYFDLMYDSDTSRFETVFRSSAQLHGFQEGQMAMWSAQKFKDVIAGRPSPKSMNAPRQEEVLSVDFASATQALVKVAAPWALGRARSMRLAWKEAKTWRDLRCGNAQDVSPERRWWRPAAWAS